MIFFWISLKSCTHAHTKHNIGPRCTEVKEGSNHGAIYLLIDVLSSLIKVKMSIGWHRCLDGLGRVHVKLLQHVIGVLGLTYERAILELLDLKSRKNFNSPIMDISNLFVIILLNSSQKATLVLPNIMSSTYIWQTKISLLTLRVNKVASTFPISNPCLSRKSFKQSYQALGAKLSP